MQKKVKIAIVAAVLSVATAMTVFAGQTWKQNSDGTWSCYEQDGSKVTGKWSEDGYWLDDNGTYIPGHKTAKPLTKFEADTNVAADLFGDGGETAISVVRNGSVGSGDSKQYRGFTIKAGGHELEMPYDEYYWDVSCYYGDINTEDNYANIVVQTIEEDEASSVFVFSIGDNNIIESAKLYGAALVSTDIDGSGYFAYYYENRFGTPQPNTTATDPPAPAVVYMTFGKLNGDEFKMKSKKVGYFSNWDSERTNATFNEGYSMTFKSSAPIYDVNGSVIGEIAPGETIRFTTEIQEHVESDGIGVSELYKVTRSDGSEVYVDTSSLCNTEGYSAWD